MEDADILSPIFYKKTIGIRHKKQQNQYNRKTAEA
jgi:hypothetical protein